MSQSSKNLLEGAATFLVGLPLWLFTEDLDVPVVTLTKVGLVLMCVGGALVALGLFQRSRESTWHSPQGTPVGGRLEPAGAEPATRPEAGLVSVPRQGPRGRRPRPCSPSSPR